VHVDATINGCGRGTGSRGSTQCSVVPHAGIPTARTIARRDQTNRSRCYNRQAGEALRRLAATMGCDKTESLTEAMTDPWPVSRYLDRLRERRDDLTKRYGIASLGVFGSYIRNEQREESDLDVLVSFMTVPGLFKVVELQDELTELLGTSVDLVVRSELKPHIGQRILAEVVEV
jgi:predicted nucleotidyltransferase